MKKIILFLFLIFYLFWIILKNGYIFNIIYSIQSFNFGVIVSASDYNKDLTKDVKDFAKMKFSNNLFEKLEKDNTFSAVYTLSVNPTGGLYNKINNTLYVTDDFNFYDKKDFSIKNNEDTITHELVHYFLTYPEIKEKAYSLQKKIFDIKKKDIEKYMNIDVHATNKEEWNIYKDKWLYSTVKYIPIILGSPVYNPKKYTFEYVYNHLEDKDINVIREEILTHRFEHMFSVMKDENIKWLNKQKEEKKLYLLFMKNLGNQ